MVRNNKMAGHNVSSVKSSEDGTYLYFTFMFEDCDYCTESDIVLVVNYFEVFGGGTRLAMPKTICASDTSTLKAGSGATEGVQDYGVLGRPGYVIWAGLMGRGDTRWKNFPVSGWDSPWH